MSFTIVRILSLGECGVAIPLPHAAPCGDGFPWLFFVPDNDFFSFVPLDVEEFVSFGDAGVPVAFVREEVFKGIDFFEWYKARVAVGVAAFKGFFLLLLSACQG